MFADVIRVLRIRLESNFGRTSRTFDIEPENLDTIVFFSKSSLLFRVELFALVNELAAGLATHGERGHQSNNLLSILCDLPTRDLRWIEVCDDEGENGMVSMAKCESRFVDSLNQRYEGDLPGGKYLFNTFRSDMVKKFDVALVL